MTEKIAPVQLLAVGFSPEAKFEGRIMNELSKLERHKITVTSTAPVLTTLPTLEVAVGDREESFSNARRHAPDTDGSTRADHPYRRSVLRATVLMDQFFCRNCGHIHVFDARRLGLLNG